jgi:hypothetical protein
MKTLIIAILMLAVPASSVFATKQEPDRIIYEGKEYPLYTYPIKDNAGKYLEKLPESKIMSTSLWRGYVATFEIKRKALFLTDIETMILIETEDGYRYPSWKSVKDQVLPEGDDLLVDSFTGILVIGYGYGKIVEHEIGRSFYHNYILLDVKNGRITGKRSLDYRQFEEFEEKQFQAYKKTDEYEQWVEELKGEIMTQEMIDGFLRYQYQEEYTSKFYYEDDKEKASNKPSGGDVQ